MSYRGFELTVVSLAAVFSIVTRYVTILKTAARETKLPGVD